MKKTVFLATDLMKHPCGKHIEWCGRIGNHVICCEEGPRCGEPLSFDISYVLNPSPAWSVFQWGEQRADQRRHSAASLVLGFGRT